MTVTINGSAGVTTNSGAVYDSLQRGTAVTASGTSVDFTSIPSWVRRVTVMFNGLSGNGTAHFLVQLGVSGTPVTTGYVSVSAVSTGTNQVLSVTSTSGFVVYSGNAANAVSGAIVFTNLTGNTWVVTQGGFIANFALSGGGGVSLSGLLNMVRITTTNGTDTFDAGSINIIYE
jgi:hypothetical protein